MKIELLFLR